jgi:hypothetical protein
MPVDSPLVGRDDVVITPHPFIPRNRCSSCSEAAEEVVAVLSG